jgi:hypothetical protein
MGKEQRAASGFRGSLWLSVFWNAGGPISNKPEAVTVELMTGKKVIITVIVVVIYHNNSLPKRLSTGSSTGTSTSVQKSGHYNLIKYEERQKDQMCLRSSCLFDGLC